MKLEPVSDNLYPTSRLETGQVILGKFQRTDFKMIDLQSYSLSTFLSLRLLFHILEVMKSAEIPLHIASVSLPSTVKCNITKMSEIQF